MVSSIWTFVYRVREHGYEIILFCIDQTRRSNQK